MARVFSETFDGLTDGESVTSSNTAFDGIEVDGSAVIEGDTGLSLSGGVSGRVVTTSSQFAIATNTFGSLVSTRYWRWYMRLAVDPTSNEIVASARSGGTNRAQFRLNNGRTTSLRNGFVAVATTTTVLTVGEWYRIEWKIDNAGGDHRLRLFHGANLHGTTPDEEISSSYSEGTFDDFSIGVVSAGSAQEINYDEIAGDDADWVGPIATSGDPATVDAVPPVATAVAPIPTVIVGTILDGQPARATAVMPTPTIVAGTTVVATVNVPVATADARMTAPSVKAAVVIAAPTAGAAATAPVPEVTGFSIPPRDITVTGVSEPVTRWAATVPVSRWSTTVPATRWTSTAPTRTDPS